MDLLFEIDREFMNSDSTVLFKPVLSDIRDSLILDKVFDEFKPQVVFHAAAYKHVPLVETNPISGLINNIISTKIVAKFSYKYSVKKMVLVSSEDK